MTLLEERKQKVRSALDVLEKAVEELGDSTEADMCYSVFVKFLVDIEKLLGVMTE